MKNYTFSGSDFWERNCYGNRSSQGTKLFTRIFTRNFPDMYNTSGLIKWAKRGQPCCSCVLG